METTEHLRDEHFLGRDRRERLNACFVQIFLFNVRALGHDLFYERGICFRFLCEHRRTARFVRTEHRRRRTVEVRVEIGDAEFVERLSYKRVLVYFVFYVVLSELSTKFGIFRNGESVELNEYD